MQKTVFFHFSNFQHSLTRVLKRADRLASQLPWQGIFGSRRLQLAHWLPRLATVFIVVGVERVVGWPIVATFLFWYFFGSLNTSTKNLINILFSIVLSSLYGLNFLTVFAFNWVGFAILYLGSIRYQTWQQIGVTGCLVVAGYWLFGLTPTVRSSIYAVFQLSLLWLVQWRLRPTLRRLRTVNI